ncbi:MAG: histidine phosphatase family protein [Candidatus Omnitrophica bacterium]|nr:histidine phosphatase family protein [Candidatus Omnitrophota bacterium]
MKCYLVRHAQTVWNGQNRLQGHSDLELNDVGLEQAKRLGAFFAARRDAGEQFLALYTSHLKRSRQTAQAIVESTGLSLRQDADLAESHLGSWEGLTPEEIDAQFDGAYERWYRHPSLVTIPGAEPLETFKQRVRGAFERIRTTENGRQGSVVIVTHGGVIASLLADWLNADYEDILRRVVFSNGGVSAIECHAMPPYVLWVNDTRHLAV